jgi:hypothetical protein
MSRDYRFLLSHLGPHILTSPFAVLAGTGGRGIIRFKKEWHPENPESELWPQLLKILSLGGSFKRGEAPYEGMAPAGREFVAPYVRSQWPVSQYPDTEGYGAIVNDREKLALARFWW